jgi:hypothetical protein
VQLHSIAYLILPVLPSIEFVRASASLCAALRCCLAFRYLLAASKKLILSVYPHLHSIDARPRGALNCSASVNARPHCSVLKLLKDFRAKDCVHIVRSRTISASIRVHAAGTHTSSLAMPHNRSCSSSAIFRHPCVRLGILQRCGYLQVQVDEVYDSVKHDAYRRLA